MLHTISANQLQIVNSIVEGNNVIVDSVAGSGKTTTNLHIATHFPEKKILLLTYNAKLRIETRNRATELELHHLEVHTYHSFCVKYYSRTCYTDTKLKGMLNKSKKTFVQEIPTYDIIIVDEIQDMSPLYFRVLYRILVDINNPDIQLCVLGDKNQSIFDFNGADSRFITRADDIFKYNDRKWEKLSLPVSFRVTRSMAMFINHCMLHRNRIEAYNEDTTIKPTYMICDGFVENTTNMVYLFIKDLLDGGAKPEDIFVLAPSLKSKKMPVSILENILKNNRKDSIPIFVPASDDSKIDEDVIKNKLVFSTCKTKYKMSPSSVRSEGGEAAAGYCLNSVSYRVDEAVKYNVLNSD